MTPFAALRFCARPGHGPAPEAALVRTNPRRPSATAEMHARLLMDPPTPAPVERFPSSQRMIHGALLRLDDHQVVGIVVAEEEQERHRAVAAHQLRVDVDALPPQLLVIGPRVARLERDARVPSG